MWVEREGGLFTNNRDDITAFIDRIGGNGGEDKDKDKNKASITRQSIEESNKEILSSAPKLDALTGFWEKLDYYINGRKEGNIVYDIEGNAVKVDYTVTGAPDLIGGLKGAGTLLNLIKGVRASRGLWTLTKEGASVIKNHKTFGTIYKSNSDGLWWAVDKAGHGGSKFKVFKEGKGGLEWFKDADKFGNFINNKHKGSTGTFIPWGQLSTVK